GRRAFFAKAGAQPEERRGRRNPAGRGPRRRDPGRLADPVPLDREVREGLGAGTGEVARGGVIPAHADDRAGGRARDQVVADYRRAGALDNAHRNADRRAADDVAGGGDVAQIRSPAQHHAETRCPVDDVAGGGDVRLNRDADAEARSLGRVGGLAGEVADDIAGDGRHAAAFLEVGDADPARRAVDDVVGDDRAGEGELGIETDLAEVAAIVAGDLDIVGGIG